MWGGYTLGYAKLTVRQMIALKAGGLLDKRIIIARLPLDRRRARQV